MDSDKSHIPDGDTTVNSNFYHIGEGGEPISGFGRGVGMRFVEHYYPKATRSIRIASSYFTLRGYQEVRNYIDPTVTLEMLVGGEQANAAKKSIAHEIQEELSRTMVPLNDAIEDLIDRIKQDRFRIRKAGEFQRSNRYKRFHCNNTFAKMDEKS